MRAVQNSLHTIEPVDLKQMYVASATDDVIPYISVRNNKVWHVEEYLTKTRRCCYIVYSTGQLVCNTSRSIFSLKTQNTP